MNASQTLAPPSRLLQWIEWRALGEVAGTLLTWPLLARAPRGDGHPVLVLPGLMASDRSTVLLRTFLRQRGYDAHGWGQGNNFGPREGVSEAMLAQLGRLHANSGRKVSVIGWSLGGLYARMLATQRPEAVRSVITLGSPIGGHPRATNAWRLYEFVSGKSAADSEEWATYSATPPAPTTSIWSRTDGIVAWRNSVQVPDKQAENIEVYASHMGIGANATVLYAVADRLAQPEGAWRPFEPPSALQAVYPPKKAESQSTVLQGRA